MESPDEGIERVIARLREERHLRKSDAKIYAARAREYYSQIQAMRKEGDNYIEICDALKGERLLPENARVKSFRQACRREFLKHEKTSVREPLPKETSKQTASKDMAKPATSKIQAGAKPQETGMSQEERNRKLGLGKPIDMGNGTVIRKNTDGSFDYD